MFFLYVARFKSGHLGGKAVILAENEDEALKLLSEKHFKKLTHDDVKFTVKSLIDRKIVYYDNGDY